MEKRITIQYSWWNDADKSKKIPTEHREFLEERAEERIKEMTDDGFNSGELLEECEGDLYRGWWEKDTKTIG